MLWAELESLAHGHLEDAGAVSVLRWHALSGYSLRLTQYTGGRVTLEGRHDLAAQAIHQAAPVDVRLATPVAAVRRSDDGVEVETRSGKVHRAAAVVVAVPLNALGAIDFTPQLSERELQGIALGQASGGSRSPSAPAAARSRRTRSSRAIPSATWRPRRCSTTAPRC